MFKKDSSSPRGFWMTLTPMPRSDSISKPMSITTTNAMAPKYAGDKSRDSTTLQPNRKIWLPPYPATIQNAACAIGCTRRLSCGCARGFSEAKSAKEQFK